MPALEPRLPIPVGARPAPVQHLGMLVPLIAPGVAVAIPAAVVNR
jgi:hypothetical protein